MKNWSIDMGQFDAMKNTPSSKEAQDQVFAKFKQRKINALNEFICLMQDGEDEDDCTCRNLTR